MEDPNAATETILKEFVVDIEKEDDFFEWMEGAPLKPLLTFSIALEESAPESLILYLNQSLIRAFDGMKKLDWFAFEIKSTAGLQPNIF